MHACLRLNFDQVRAESEYISGQVLRTTRCATPKCSCACRVLYFVVRLVLLHAVVPVRLVLVQFVLRNTRGAEGRGKERGKRKQVRCAYFGSRGPSNPKRESLRVRARAYLLVVVPLVRVHVRVAVGVEGRQVPQVLRHGPLELVSREAQVPEAAELRELRGDSPAQAVGEGESGTDGRGAQSGRGIWMGAEGG